MLSRMSDPGDPLMRWLQATIVNSVRERHDDLTLRQLAVMMITYLEDETPTVRGLAKALRISRPAISRALDRLGEAGLTRRQTDPHDRRSVVVRRTRKGTQRMQQLRDMMTTPVGDLADSAAKSPAGARPNASDPCIEPSMRATTPERV